MQGFSVIRIQMNSDFNVRLHNVENVAQPQTVAGCLTQLNQLLRNLFAEDFLYGEGDDDFVTAFEE